jgi:hypothetical protein
MDASGFSLLLPKALPSESPRTRNFPSLTDDKAGEIKKGDAQ